MFMSKQLAIKVMDCRTLSVHRFETKLLFKQYDAIIKKEQSVLEKIKIFLENIKSQHRQLGVGGNSHLCLSSCAVCAKKN